MGAQIGGGDARRIGRADHRAHRRPGDDAGPDTEIVEGFEHRDMGEAARAARAEREADARAHRKFSSSASAASPASSATKCPQASVAPTASGAKVRRHTCSAASACVR